MYLDHGGLKAWEFPIWLIPESGTGVSYTFFSSDRGLNISGVYFQMGHAALSLCGTGCVWRPLSLLPLYRQNHTKPRVYLDGAREPRLENSLTDKEPAATGGLRIEEKMERGLRWAFFFFSVICRQDDQQVSISRRFSVGSRSMILSLFPV